MPTKKQKRARMPAAWGPPPKRLRLHIENVAAMDLVYKITRERYEAAAKRHKSQARRIDATVAADPKKFDKAIAEADILVGWRFDRENLAERAPNLKWIHLTGAGIEHVMPLDWLPPGTVLTNNRGVHAPKARQFAMTALLMLNERIPELVTEQRKAKWSRLYSTAIEGKTALIIGVGMMGDAAARAAKSLGLRVLGIRRSGAPNRLCRRDVHPGPARRASAAQRLRTRQRTLDRRDGGDAGTPRARPDEADRRARQYGPCPGRRLQGAGDQAAQGRVVRRDPRRFRPRAAAQDIALVERPEPDHDAAMSLRMTTTITRR